MQMNREEKRASKAGTSFAGDSGWRQSGAAAPAHVQGKSCERRFNF